MIYSDFPPYDILKNNQLSFNQLQIMKRFARFWDIFYNSSNFKKSIKMIWQDNSVFENFYTFCLWIYEQTDSTWKISLQRQGELLFDYLCNIKNIEAKEVADIMLEDMLKLKGRAVPHYLKPFAKDKTVKQKFGTSGFNKRQNYYHSNELTQSLLG